MCARSLALTALVGCTDDPELEPQACAGDRIVTDEAQLADVAGCSEVTGDLQISGLDVTAIVLPELTTTPDSRASTGSTVWGRSVWT